MNDQELPTILLRWSNESTTSPGMPEPNEVIYEISGDIFELDDVENEEFIGKFSLYYIDLELALNRGKHIFEVFDDHSDELCKYYDALFKPGGEYDFNENVGKIDDFMGINLLILNKLEILPRFRKKKLGLVVLRHMVERFSSGAELVAMKPFPLQFEAIRESNEWRDQMELDRFPKFETATTKKLHDYYRKIGFVDLPGTPMMIRSKYWKFPEIS